jgi:putative PIN family toxin of toxin-antitoxin system
VIDVNVWISALLTPGTARKLINHLKAARFELAYSNQIFDELLEVASRRRLAQKLSTEDKLDLTDLIKQRGVLVELEQPLPPISRDPKDDIYLSCALVSDSDFLVTGDKDLLVIETYGRAKIISPAEFLVTLESTI